MSDPPLLKDLVDRDSVKMILDAVAAVADGVDTDVIVDGEIFDDRWEDRALKERIRHIAVTIRSHLPEDYGVALAALRRAAARLETGGISTWVFNDFVEEYGVDHPDLSLPALEQFTKLASAEFAVRPFIRVYPDRMAEQMLEWAHDPDPRVRRLASEGYRPRLPWGMGIPALKKDPAPVLPVLVALRCDPSEDVRRSVANNLNDISKDHPDLVVAFLSEWDETTPEAEALTRHALRTLLKRGHGGALDLLGFSPQPAVAISDATVLPRSVPVGGIVWLEFMVTSVHGSSQSLMVDYAVRFQNASGAGSRKVFKGRVVELGAGDAFSMRRKISLRPMSTRRIFPGPHEVEIQVNGAVLEVVRFEVTTS